MIAFCCSSCQKSLSVKEEFAGTKARCPGCGQMVVVPAPVAAGSSSEDSPTVPPPFPCPHPEPSAASNPPTHPPSNRPDATQGADKPHASHDFSLTAFLAPPQTEDELGRLGPYRVLKVLGAGGMGVVFQAEDPHLQRLVALKTMLPTLGASDSARQRFQREARAAAAITHDNIVAIYQVGEDRGAPFLAMQFLEGQPLDQRLKQEPPLTLPEVLRIGRETAQGLAAAHKGGLIHRDIKPANLWLEAPGDRVKILDFGLARSTSSDAHLTQEGAIVGTPAFMAPEQARGEAVDARTDLFSLGVVLYRLCTGRQPFKGKDTISTLVAVATDQPRPPRELRPDLPGALSDLVMRLLAKNPEERPESALVVAETLQAIAEQPSEAPALSGGRRIAKGTESVPGPQPERPAKKRSRLPWLVGGLGCLAVGGLLAFFLATARDNRASGDRLSLQGEPPVAEVPKLTKNELPPAEVLELTKGKAPDAKQPDPPPPTFKNKMGMEFVVVPRGRSWLGGGGGKPGAQEVVFRYDFYLGKYEVTQEEWQKIMGSIGFRKGKGKVKEDQKRFPKGNVSWDEAQMFLRQMNAQEKETGWVYRLPKEVEWEYACRGGPMTDKAESAFDYYFETPTNQLLATQARFGRENGINGRTKVGSYKPNRLGLYDMHGNVWELCLDTRPRASHRAMRGGGWQCTPVQCRAAHPFGTEHYFKWASLGLRVARIPRESK